MDDLEFTLQLGILKEYPRRSPSKRCHNSDGLNQCDCHLLFGRDSHKCGFYGRPIEPLAFYLPPFSQVNQQDHCPLYTVLPQEIRDLVWEYTLADNGIPSPNCENVFPRELGTEAHIAKTDVAHTLLQTCKAVYLETYRLPMLLNGYLSYRLNGPSRPDLERIAPWQYALIQRLDLCLKQARVERDGLGRKLRHWEPALRHSGVYVAPRYYGLREAFRPTIVIPAHNFGLVVPPGDSAHKLTDGDKVILPQEYRGFDSSERAWMRIKSNFTARAMVARTLTHLTLRMSRTDWWTWSNDPDTIDDDRQLALDPACGWSARPLVSEMLALAASRRKGQHPAYERTWGATIGTLQDLKSVELILETFSIKKHQLETVVECAQTWKFPLEDTQYELAYDGKMESMQWAQAADENSSSVADSKLGGMDVDLNEGDSSCGEQREAHDSRYEDSASNQESLHMDEEAQGRDQEVEDVFNENELPHPVYKPEDWPVEHHEHYDSAAGTSPMSSVYKPDDCPVEQSEYSSSPISPRWDPVSDSDDLESLPDEPWMHTATEFEVRVVRFTRRRVN